MAAPRGGAVRRDRARSTRHRGALVWYLIAGACVSAVFVVPLAWEVLRSLQPESAVTNAPSAHSFSHLGFGNYQALLSGQQRHERGDHGNDQAVDDIADDVVNSLI